MGAGLGGLVAQTATPYSTANYGEDARFQHTTDIDSAVVEEGLVAILGVPMRLGGCVIGVLFAANRTARPFARSDVSLLASLAAHATVAIDNAQLLEDTRTALAELSVANKVAQEHSAAVERAAEAHDRMAELVVRGGDVADLAASVADLLGGAVAIVDTDGRRLASVGDVGPVDAVTQFARGLGRTIQRGDCWVATVGAGNDPLGMLVLRATGDLVEADLRILERAAVVTALLLLSRRGMVEAENQVRGELLDDLIARPNDLPNTVLERARRVGVDLEAPHAVLVLHSGSELRKRAAGWAASQAAAQSGLAAYRDGVAVLLLPSDDASCAAQRVAREFKASTGQVVTVGAAGPVQRPADVAEAYHVARRCADALVALGQVGAGASPADLGFVGLLLGADPSSTEGSTVDQYVAATIGPVLEYDRRRNTELGKTLDVYFGVGASPVRAAEALHVHVNTVTQRIDRLSKLLGDDWQRPDRALELQLALRLHRLRGQ
jgi:sugar diacid utilization regulator